MHPIIHRTFRALATLVLSAIISALLVAALNAVSQDPQKPDVKSPEDVKAEETFTRNCVKCHPADRINGTRRTRTQWEEVMTTMQTARGAVIVDEDWDVIQNYLVKQHGRVNVNRATSTTVECWASLRNAIGREYRKEHGNSRYAVREWPGLDPEWKGADAIRSDRCPPGMNLVPQRTGHPQIG